MARTLEGIVAEQIGQLSLQLARQDIQLELLTEENKALKEQIDKLTAKEDK